MNELFLMHKDTVVCSLTTGKVYIEKDVPYGLNGAGAVDVNLAYKWLLKRVIPINRKNSEKIYKAIGLARLHTEIEMMLITHGLSINDNYWVGTEDDIRKYEWKNINLFNNSLNQSITKLAFTGTGPATITGNELSPEFTGQGTYAKCFTRKEKDLVLYKQGTVYEITAEVMSSYIANILGISHIDYWYDKLYGRDASVCKIHTNEQISWESAFHFTAFTERLHGINIVDFSIQRFPLAFYQMVLLDGLILNEDRHLQNWSIELSGDTNDILGMAPNYDFNRAFKADRSTQSQLIFGKNILSAAKEANSLLGVDLITCLVPHIKNIPQQWQEALYNRILYIMGKKSNQNDCY